MYYSFLLILFSSLAFFPSPIFSITDEKVTIPSGVARGCENTNSCYLPSSLTVQNGNTVTWKNLDSFPHTITSGNPRDGPDGKFDSNLLQQGEKFSHTFSNAGTFDYFCMIHPWKEGLIIVKEDKRPPTPEGPDNTVWIAIGIAGAAIAGGIGVLVTRKKKPSDDSSQQKDTSSTPTTSHEATDRKCNVCSTNIPEGVNICPNCGDIYS